MATATKYPHIVSEAGQSARLEKHPRLRVSMIVSHYLDTAALRKKSACTCLT